MRYVDHEFVESYKAAAQHKTYEARLNEQGPTDDELAWLKELYDQAIDKYGKDFQSPEMDGLNRFYFKKFFFSCYFESYSWDGPLAALLQMGKSKYSCHRKDSQILSRIM